MDDGVSVRRLGEQEWPEAMTLTARSFLSESFMADMFGVPLVQRFAGAHRYYQGSRQYAADVRLGAFVDDVLVGLCLSSPPGGCHVCEHVDPQQPPEDHGARLDWEFEVSCRLAHAPEGSHAWLGRLVVDPALQGAGLGRTLVAKTLDALRPDQGSVRVLLECQPHREALYARCGFETIASIPDPAAGPDCFLMRAHVG